MISITRRVLATESNEQPPRQNAEISLDFQPAFLANSCETSRQPDPWVSSVAGSETPKGFRRIRTVPTDADPSLSSYIDVGHGRIGRFLAQTIGINSVNSRLVGSRTDSGRATRSGRSNRRSDGIQKASVVVVELGRRSDGTCDLLTASVATKQIPGADCVGPEVLPGTPARLVYHPWTMAYVDEPGCIWILARADWRRPTA